MSAVNRRVFIVASGATAIAGRHAMAAEYPERPITIVVPYAAGGAGDISVRLLGSAIERYLGQPLVIDARAGGGGTIGAQSVARASPDGYTLLLGATNNFTINQFMFPEVRFDPLAAFTLITKLTDVPAVLYTNPLVPAKTLSEFIDYARANPGKLNYASPSIGTTPHLAVERLKQLTGIELVHVPYRGASPAMQALLANEVQLYLVGWGVGRSQVEAGRIRALAVASRQRLPGIPLPTVIESGVPDFVTSNWWGLAAPRGTPLPVLDQLYDAVRAALADETCESGWTSSASTAAASPRKNS
jgi:tripartite-type tricarboxylate transporter receptor subunit TctC